MNKLYISIVSLVVVIGLIGTSVGAFYSGDGDYKGGCVFKKGFYSVHSLLFGKRHLNFESIEKTMKKIDNGVVITITSDDEEVVKKLHEKVDNPKSKRKHLWGFGRKMLGLTK